MTIFRCYAPYTGRPKQRKPTVAQWAVLVFMHEAGASGYLPTSDELRSCDSVVKRGLAERMDPGEVRRYRLTAEGLRFMLAAGRIKRIDARR